MSNDKRATTRFPLHDLIAKRWSPRAFDTRAVSSEDLGALFEAARWAPSCFNDQPWSFIVGVRGANDGNAWQKIHDVLVPSNQAWAKRAPVLAISVARHAFALDGRANRHAVYDTGAAALSLTLQAEALGLVVHQMGGFDTDAARKVFALPAGHDAIAAMAIGYATRADVLPEDLAKRESATRERRPLDKSFFGGTFGVAHPVVG